MRHYHAVFHIIFTILHAVAVWLTLLSMGVCAADSVNDSETIMNIMLFEYKKWNHAVNMIPLICVVFLSCVLENRFNKEYDSYNDCNR